VRTCLRSILQAVPGSRVHFAQSTNWRAMPREDLDRLYREETGQGMPDLPGAGEEGEGGGECSTRATIRRVLHLAAAEPGCAVVCCGTAYIMPDALRELGKHMPSDADDLAREA